MKKEIGREVILLKYQIARSKIKQKIDASLKIISKELISLEKLKKKYSFNEENEKLLNERMALLIDFKTELIESWADTLKKAEY
jgi:hypothetical protein